MASRGCDLSQDVVESRYWAVRSSISSKTPHQGGNLRMERSTRIGVSLGAFFGLLLGAVLIYYIQQAMVDPYISRYKEILDHLIFMDILAYLAGMAIICGLIGLAVIRSKEETSSVSNAGRFNQSCIASGSERI